MIYKESIKVKKGEIIDGVKPDCDIGWYVVSSRIWIQHLCTAHALSENGATTIFGAFICILLSVTRYYKWSKL